MGKGSGRRPCAVPPRRRPDRFQHVPVFPRHVTLFRCPRAYGAAKILRDDYMSYVLLGVLLLLLALLQLRSESKPPEDMRILQVRTPADLTPSVLRRRNPVVIADRGSASVPWQVRCMYPWKTTTDMEAHSDAQPVRCSLLLLDGGDGHVDVAQGPDEEFVRIRMRPGTALIAHRGARLRADVSMRATSFNSTPSLFVSVV